MYYTKKGNFVPLQKGEGSLESFNERPSLPFGLIFKFSRHPNTSYSPETAFPSGIPGGGGVGWSLRSTGTTEEWIRSCGLKLVVSLSFPLASLSSLLSRSATTPSGTRDSAQADQQKRASPCLHLHSRERPSMSLQSMTTLSSLLSRRKGGTMTVEFAFRHWYTRTCTRSFSTIWKGVVLRNSFDSREEIKKARNWANGDNDWRVVGNSSISASGSSRRQSRGGYSRL